MIDYRRALRIMRDGEFDGYISIELAHGRRSLQRDPVPESGTWTK